MLRLSRLSSLSATIFHLLIAASFAPSALAQHASPRELADARLLPEHAALQRRHAAIEERLATQLPIGMRKMSGDPTEKFFPEYWIFDGVDHEAEESELRRHLEGFSVLDEACGDAHRDGSDTFTNITSLDAYRPPLLPHSSGAFSLFDIHPRNLFSKRGYQCPSGYNNCAGIGYVNTCCESGETCQIIANTGIGVVGCCPSGGKCSGSVSSCDTSQGYTSCPDEQNNNGCCSPGFVCDAVGCVQGSTAQPVGVTTKTLYATAIITPEGLSTVYTTVTTPTSTVILSAQSLSTATTILTTTITGTVAAPPVRATSAASVFTTASTVEICPTNYYRCSAYYMGGCCQVGMDCQSTHCPSQATTDVTSNGVVTVIVNEGSGVTTISEGDAAASTTTTAGNGGVVTVAGVVTAAASSTVDVAQGACPRGFFSCVADNGGCCPTGYACGATCSATQAGIPDTVQKVQPSSGAASARALGYGMTGLALVLGIGMVCL